ncbi:uncharacterized protein N7484_009722 [Penicillium longicatenatum]|uniref:uncharacterized protein n=1 Tax=Penicillium longicatenatum TaxID=1561947 RepID=UPI002546DB8B|nr:uncharacterized protein N7484_009722 [Penicillium longicatenatum]KAJ5636409.1 hypothetical protein N7484_009722 [Penicillium longicatenatum]
MSHDTLKSPSWLRAQGAKVTRWINSPTEPGCPILKNTLSYEEIEEKTTKFERNANIDIEITGHTLLLPPWVVAPPTERGGYVYYTMRFDRDQWTGFFAPGILVIQSMRRVIPGTPHPSDIALTLYAREQGRLDNLRYVFATTILNWQTKHFISQELYDSWPGVEPRCWEYGTKEYEGIMGTRIGRTVAYLVLGGFERGTRRIVRIVTYNKADELDIRFDIRPVTN